MQHGKFPHLFRKDFRLTQSMELLAVFQLKSLEIFLTQYMVIHQHQQSPSISTCKFLKTPTAMENQTNYRLTIQLTVLWLKTLTMMVTVLQIWMKPEQESTTELVIWVQTHLTLIPMMMEYVMVRTMSYHNVLVDLIQTHSEPVLLDQLYWLTIRWPLHSFLLTQCLEQHGNSHHSCLPASHLIQPLV